MVTFFFFLPSALQTESDARELLETNSVATLLVQIREATLLNSLVFAVS
jgi:hypothetical protein